MPKHRNNPALGRQDGRSLALRVDKAEEKSRTVELSFSSETPYERFFGPEVLSHRPEDVDLSTLEQVGVVLFSHGLDNNYSRMPIGRIVKAWLDESGHRGRALIRFDDDADSDKVYQKVLSGSLRGVSVGYSVSEWLELADGQQSEDGRFTGPAFVAVKWQPMEISIEPTPADTTIGVGRSIKNKEGNAMPKRKRSDEELEKDIDEVTEEEEREDEEDETREDEEEYAPEEEDEEREDEEAEKKGKKSRTVLDPMKAERRRASAITDLCRSFDVDPTPYIKSGNPVSHVKTAILQKMAAERGAMTNVRVQQDGRDKFRAAASDALLMRAGVRVQKPANGANELRGMRLRDLAVECVSRTGKSETPYRMNDAELLRAALSPDSAFESILSDSINKSLSAAYQGVPTTYQQWTGTGSVSDFKGATHYRISEFGGLVPLTQAGEFKADESIDQGVKKSIATFGRTLTHSQSAFKCRLNHGLLRLDSRCPLWSGHCIVLLTGISSHYGLLWYSCQYSQMRTECDCYPVFYHFSRIIIS